MASTIVLPTTKAKLAPTIAPPGKAPAMRTAPGALLNSAPPVTSPLAFKPGKPSAEETAAALAAGFTTVKDYRAALIAAQTPPPVNSAPPMRAAPPRQAAPDVQAKLDSYQAEIKRLQAMMAKATAKAPNTLPVPFSTLYDPTIGRALVDENDWRLPLHDYCATGTPVYLCRFVWEDPKDPNAVNRPLPRPGAYTRAWLAVPSDKDPSGRAHGISATYRDQGAVAVYSGLDADGNIGQSYYLVQEELEALYRGTSPGSDAAPQANKPAAAPVKAGGPRYPVGSTVTVRWRTPDGTHTGDEYLMTAGIEGIDGPETLRVKDAHGQIHTVPFVDIVDIVDIV
jgi:hypothetical protein